MTLAGMVVASLVRRVVVKTAMAIAEPKERILPDRPPAVPISSCVRRGNVVPEREEQRGQSLSPELVWEFLLVDVLTSDGHSLHCADEKCTRSN